MRVDDAAVLPKDVAHRRQGLLRADGGGDDALVDGLAVVHRGFAVGREIRHEPAHALGIAAEAQMQEALEVAGDLDVHGRADGVAHLAALVDAALEEARQDVVVVRGQHEAAYRHAHGAHRDAGEDVAEVAGGNGEDGAVARRPAVQGRMDVVGHLREHPRPVHGVDGAERVVLLEGRVAEGGFQDRLAVVEAALDGQTMHVGVRHGGHLPLLQGADPPSRIQHEDVDVRPPPNAVDGRAAGVAAGRAHDVQAPLPHPQNVLEQAPEHLQRHVLEGERGAVEELQHLVLAEVHKRHDLRMVEGREGVRDDAVEHLARDVVHVQPKHPLRHFGEGERPPRIQLIRDVHEALRHEQPAVGREAGQHGVREPQRRAAAAGGDVAHA